MSKKLVKDFFRKEDVPQKEFFEDLSVLIVKTDLLIQFVESIWLKHLTLDLCPKLNFPFKRLFHKNINMVYGENQLVVCSSYIGKMSFYNY
jgi:hypothetical protein